MRPRDTGKGSPADWLRHARSDLRLAQARQAGEEVLYESLCFHAQQAAEKALKGVLVFAGVEVLRTHNIAVLVELLPAAIPRIPALQDAALLTDYAVSTRYPSESEAVTREELDQAAALAARIVGWAEAVIRERKASREPDP